MTNLFVRGLRLKERPTKDEWLWGLPAVRALAGEGIPFTKPVTFLVGENGAGKSTLIEGLAVAAGFNAEGGSRNFDFSTVRAHSALHEFVTVLRGARRPADGFFLRAESFFNVASAVDVLREESNDRFMDNYGGVSLHERSHGESFLALVQNRFWGEGLYILDEPEAALSPTRQLALLREMKRLVDGGSQFIIATHSPILMAYPNASVLLLEENGIHATTFRNTDHYIVSRRFFADPEGFLEKVLAEEE